MRLVEREPAAAPKFLRKLELGEPRVRQSRVTSLCELYPFLFFRLRTHSNPCAHPLNTSTYVIIDKVIYSRYHES